MEDGTTTGGQYGAVGEIRGATVKGPTSLRPPTVLLLLLTILVVVAVAVGSVSSTRDFGAYNPAWDGTSTLRGWIDDAGGGPNVVLEPATYRTLPANDSVVFVVAPRTASRTESLEGFVRRGGTVVVMDDRGNRSNELLASLGASARIDGTAIRDERHNYHSPAMPIATTVSNESLAGTADRLTFNYGTAVRPNGATTLANTSSFGYLDRNGNETLDGTERLGSYPVATVENVSDGRVVAVGDPSIAINSMVSRPGNERFVRGLIDAHDRAVFDYTHVEGPPPFALVLIVLRRSLAAQLTLVAGIGLLALGARHPEEASRAAGRLSSRLGGIERFSGNDETPPRVDSEEVVTAIQRRYPSWPRDRIERIVAESRTGREGGKRDD